MAIIPTQKIVSAFGYLAAFSIASGSNLSDVETTPNFVLFVPVKIREEVSETPIPIVEALPTTEPPKYI